MVARLALQLGGGGYSEALKQLGAVTDSVWPCGLGSSAPLAKMAERTSIKKHAHHLASSKFVLLSFSAVVSFCLFLNIL